jgi:hypothetical protein
MPAPTIGISGNVDGRRRLTMKGEPRRQPHLFSIVCWPRDDLRIEHLALTQPGIGKGFIHHRGRHSAP